MSDQITINFTPVCAANESCLTAGQKEKTDKKGEALQSVPLLPIISPPLANNSCDLSGHMSKAERQIYALAIKARGVSRQPGAELAGVDLSKSIRSVKLVNASQLEAFYDGDILVVNQRFAAGKNDAQIQAMTAKAIVEYARGVYQKVFSDQQPDQGLKRNFDYTLSTLADGGFRDDRLLILQSLALTTLSPEDRRFFDSQLEIAFSTTQPAVAAQKIKDYSLSLQERKVGLYERLGNKPTNKDFLERREIEGAEATCSAFALAFGLNLNQLGVFLADALAQRHPEFKKRVAALSQGKNDRKKLELYQKLWSRDPLDLKAALEGEFLANALWRHSFPNLTIGELHAELYIKLQLPKDCPPEIADLYRQAISQNDAYLKLQKTMPEKLKSVILPRLLSLAGPALKKFRARSVELVQYLAEQEVLKDAEAAAWQLKMLWPDLSDEEIGLLHTFQTAPRALKQTVKVQLDRLDPGRCSAGFKQALSFNLIQDRTDIEVQGLIDDLDRLENFRPGYEKLLQEAAVAARRGDRSAFEQLWTAAGKVAEKAEKLRLTLSAREEEHARQVTAVLFDPDDVDQFKLSYNSASKASSLVKITRQYLKTTYDKVKNASSWNLRRSLRDLVIDDSKSGEYFDHDTLAPGWNFHARQKEINKLLTDERVRAIKVFAWAYHVDPALVAALIISEQRDQSDAENVTDFVGGIAGYNTSIGLGQISVTTARELFPEKFSKAWDATVTQELENDNFNIQAVAKLIARIIAEGKSTLKRDPTIPEIGSRYTSTSFNGWRWGRFVEMAYHEARLSGRLETDHSSLEKLKELFDRTTGATPPAIDFYKRAADSLTKLDAEVWSGAPFYKSWEDKLVRMSAFDYANATTQEQICAYEQLNTLEAQIELEHKIQGR